MVWDDIAEAEETVGILIEAELEIHHRLLGHHRPLRQCPVCRALTTPSAGAADPARSAGGATPTLPVVA